MIATLACGLMLSACGASNTPTTTNQVADNQRQGRLIVVPMHLVAGGGGQAPAPPIHLAADGTISLAERPIQRIEGQRIVNLRGEEVLHVESDGRVVLASPQGPSLRFDPDGSLVASDGVKLSVEDSGTPVRLKPGEEPQRLGGHWENFRPEHRATAVLLLAAVMVQMSAGPASGTGN